MVREIKTPSDLRFPPYRLDVANACLWRRTKAIRLTPKAFAVLRCLAEHPGELFTKEALLEAVWPGITVSDAVLKVCVGEIRKALGDPVGAPRYIATVHGRGYRFVAEVSDADPRPERDLVGPRRAPTDLSAARIPYYRTPAHFVGRAAAVDALQRALDAAWRGTRQVVFVTGEPGIGKTGVVDAFLERAAADSRVWI